jgi:hypothetical protein
VGAFPQFVIKQAGEVPPRRPEELAVPVVASLARLPPSLSFRLLNLRLLVFGEFGLDEVNLGPHQRQHLLDNLAALVC